MKKILFLNAFLLLTTVAIAQYDRFFEETTLRVDYIHAGTDKTEFYALENLIKEPYWGGSKTNLIDTLRYGDYFFEVYDSESQQLIYSRGYCNLFGEWQTTEEAERVQRSFDESIVLPFPKHPVDVRFYSRNHDDGNFDLKFQIAVDPKDYFIKPAKKLPFAVFNVYGDNPSEQAVDIVILPDGYTNAELGNFITDCQSFAKSLFAYEPFKSHQDRFNIRAVLAYSDESGVAIPADSIWPQTALSSSFYTFDSERYCMSYDHTTIRDLAGQTPYDQIYILTNTEKYGGGGIYNFYSISAAGNTSSPKIIVHEFGHAFAGLGDEYFDSSTAYDGFYNLAIEPWEPNLTTLVDFDKKWKHLIGKKTPIPTSVTEKTIHQTGVFEGGGYCAKGMYRPAFDCLMHTFKGDFFCETCSAAIIQMIHFYSD